jgi:hypothetical protein
VTVSSARKMRFWGRMLLPPFKRGAFSGIG